ncbi:D-aminopeptidase [Clostridium homopropionicum DSM 5847]|uniref:D-aminopeptidase n=1 Tax=Clostridium homopropionicum DSM 5847 TaxID=1121318 RepID=A0A0L6ZEA5_9CLOT|nr:M55 family metallopeptidase [Clostridium homopropionicum]KOA21314.1 D-aminopeptidase [Clostridium homopropionicum DSM 5847]SFG95552.1 D-amino peptidase [Clostridium homopropionicum]
MKIFISADIEGTTGINSWDETEKSKIDYSMFAEQMNREVLAACNGAIKAGAKEIYIKDAHDSGRNLNPGIFPKNIKFIRGWSGHPFSMVEGLDGTFDGVVFIGYHSAAGTGYNPLSHTMNPFNIDFIKINGQLASEFTLHAYTAAYLGVPALFLSGDKGICEEVKTMNSSIRTVAVNEGVGASTLSIHPDLAVEVIEKSVEEALRFDLSLCKLKLPEEFNLEIGYIVHSRAYKSSFYPGAKLISPKIISFKTKDYFEVLRAISFLC